MYGILDVVLLSSVKFRHKILETMIFWNIDVHLIFRAHILLLQVYDLSLLFTVIILCVNGPRVREIMLAAYEMGLINGEYAFFSYYPFNNKFLFGDDNWKQVRKFAFYSKMS